MSFSFLHESESIMFSAAQLTNLVCRHRRLGGVTTAFFGNTLVMFQPAVCFLCKLVQYIGKVPGYKRFKQLIDKVLTFYGLTLS